MSGPEQIAKPRIAIPEYKDPPKPDAPVHCQKCGKLTDWEYEEPMFQFPTGRLVAGGIWKRRDFCSACTLEMKQQNQIEELRKLHQHRWKISGLSAGHERMTFATMTPSHYREFFIEWAKNPALNVYLHGDPGVGKSHILAACINAVLLQRTAHYWRSVDFIAYARRLVTDQEQQDRRAAEDWIEDILEDDSPFALDDLGVEKVTDWTYQLIYNLFDGVEVKKRRGILVASNFNPDELADRLDHRIASRIVGNFKVIRITGDDHRMRR